MNNFKILIGDCREKLKELPDNSVDSVVTDPPYEIGFMGRKWDSTGIAYDKDVWKECLRVLKPGGHLLAFGATRTQHRMVCAIEDSGFEIRDQIMWIYGSGFPKSINVGNAIDKARAENLEEIGEAIKDIPSKDLAALCDVSVALVEFWKKGERTIQPAEIEKVKQAYNLEIKYTEEKREVVGIQEGAMSGWSMDGGTKFVDRAIMEPTSQDGKRWQGWGTFLKPANEPICLARKPFKGTVVENVLKHGTGAINIDGCRVGESGARNNGRKASSEYDSGVQKYGDFGAVEPIDYGKGRFPANVIHDGSEEVVALFPDSKSGKENGERGTGGIWSGVSNKPCGPQYGDSGSAARFFYSAKTSAKDRDEGLENFPEMRIERNDGELGRKSSIEARMADGGHNAGKAKNIHTTVKPTDLMRYLCRLVTPKGGVVLDPFMGSGSTGKGAMWEGMDFIGIEMDEKYAEIAEARIIKARADYEKENQQLSFDFEY